MNNIYKVIWSKVANALVVVSELARSKGVPDAIQSRHQAIQ
ncbi:ESPR domain-containing protein [Aggregatibacter segnis]